MPYSLRLALALRAAGWKVKIYDGERLEPPHITIIRRSDVVGRLCLRTKTFLDTGPSWSDIPAAIARAVDEHWDEIRKEWDRMYPDNPISGQGDDDDNDK